MPVYLQVDKGVQVWADKSVVEHGKGYLDLDFSAARDLPSTYNSSLTHPSLISFLAFCRSSRFCFRSCRLIVRCIFSHISREYRPDSVSVTDIASIVNVMSRWPMSRCGLVWSTGHARTECSIALDLYLAKLLKSPAVNACQNLVYYQIENAWGPTYARTYSLWPPTRAISHR